MTMRSYGVLVVDGCQFHDMLVRYRNAGEQYHFSSNIDTQEGFRQLIQSCFDLVTTIQVPAPWWNAVSRMDWPLVEARLLPLPAAPAPAEERMVEEDEVAEVAAVLDEADLWVERHEEEIASRDRSMSPRERMKLLDADATAEVLREAQEADRAARVVNPSLTGSPQGAVGQAETPSAGASQGSAGTTGSFVVVTDPMAVVASPAPSPDASAPEQVMMTVGRSFVGLG